ncbi:hypothetical protein ACWCSD_42315 [Nonomuraea sp. NPDC001684]
MSFKISPTQDTSVELNVSIADADPIPRHHGKPYKPNRVDIYWNWTSATGWTLDGFKIHGLDGTAPVSRWQDAAPGRAPWAPAAYWALAEATRPTWQPSLAAAPAS